MFFVEELWVKLHTENRSCLVLHRLDWAAVVPGSSTESFRKFLDLIEVGMPDSEFISQPFEQPLGNCLDRKVATLSFGALVTDARFEARHQIYSGAVCQSYLLMPTANAKNWLFGILYGLKDSG